MKIQNFCEDYHLNILKMHQFNNPIFIGHVNGLLAYIYDQIV